MEYSVKYLIMVNPDNNGVQNNKYYQMTNNGDGTFTVKYGRVGASEQTRSYSISQWYKKYNEKINKGYQDVTDLQEDLIVKEEKKKDNTYREIQNKVVSELVDKLQSLAKASVDANYKVKANAVTQKMVDKAQELLDSLVDFKGTVDEFNEQLIKLFTIIPRKMGNVNEYLIRDIDDIQYKITEEADILDTMRGQVYVKDISTQDDNDTPQNDMTILEALGLEIEEVTDDEIQMIKDLMNESKNKFRRAWKVTNIKTQKRFDDFVKKENIKDTRLLFHGSRSENFWSILQTGLVLRPTNAIITGKMFGYGVYYSPHCQKSIGYTSLNGSYWARGNNHTAYMALFDVAYGVPYDVYSFESKYYNLNYENLQGFKKGANCLHAHKDKGMLRNDEIVVYKEEQMTIKYLIEIGD